MRLTHVALLAALVVLGACMALPASEAQAQAPLLPDLQRAARRARTEAAPHRAYARALLRAGRFRDAEREFKVAARLSRNQPSALLEVAEATFATGDWNAARRACTAIETATEQHSAWSRVCRAQAFLVGQRSARAFEELELALAEMPDLAQAHLALGDAHRFRADTEQALRAYRRAAELDATSAAPHLGMGLLYAATGRRDEAIAALREAQRLEGSWPAVQRALGQLLPPEEGLPLLRAAAEGYPDWAAAQADLGRAEQLAGHPAEARAALTRALQLDPELAPAHATLGLVQLAQGEREAAEASFRHALQLVPNDAATATALADLFAATERYEEALEQYRAAADMSPSDPTPLLSGARLAVRLGRSLFATAYLDLALERRPGNWGALDLYGDVMLARGDRARARTYFQDALRAAPVEARAGIEAKLRGL
ncbi:MAG: tetratricopeptide repeat protein [Sandaracinaceae bacterium]|jgi:tetratricopeptide (TPR) repeat protein|nr:tetratricopeptide repeat protein [Sandaracinaceae bacterium]MBK8587805.1 tetratricopeptide repeat protein [Sandaracinaceae bacterium]MBP7681459.1 tetratricopeptide repeat protein [Deltaproteobacteria bacterium]